MKISKKPFSKIPAGPFLLEGMKVVKLANECIDGCYYVNAVSLSGSAHRFYLDQEIEVEMEDTPWHQIQNGQRFTIDDGGDIYIRASSLTGSSSDDLIVNLTGGTFFQHQPLGSKKYYLTSAWPSDKY